MERGRLAEGPKKQNLRVPLALFRPQPERLHYEQQMWVPKGEWPVDGSSRG